jgi:tryptophan-rich sensory protein
MTNRAQSFPWLALIGWLLAAFAGAVGAIASVDAAAFYAGLSRPAWAPPGWVFGPVWTLLYTLMGVAAFRVWRAPGDRHLALTLFGLQLAVNALWSWLFFAWHRGALAAIEVLVLLALIAATLFAFRRHDRLSAWLMLPYLLWVAFASLLTWTIWLRNPDVL